LEAQWGEVALGDLHLLAVPSGVAEAFLGVEACGEEEEVVVLMALM
jgi:hypothetical protein